MTNDRHHIDEDGPPIFIDPRRYIVTIMIDEESQTEIWVRSGTDPESVADVLMELAVDYRPGNPGFNELSGETELADDEDHSLLMRSIPATVYPLVVLYDQNGDIEIRGARGINQLDAARVLSQISATVNEQVAAQN